MGIGMSDAPRQTPPKKDVALALLEQSSVFVHLDPRKPGVSVPKWFTTQPQLVLQVGLNMAIPIPDLRVDDDGISCTLSFNRSPFWCCLPWTAIYALVGENGQSGVWADDVPPEIQVQKQTATGKPAAAKRARPKLAAVSSPSETGPEEPQAAPAEPAAPEEAEAAPKSPARPQGLAAVAPSPEPAVAVEEGETSVARDDKIELTARPAGKKPKREIPSYLRVIK